MNISQLPPARLGRRLLAAAPLAALAALALSSTPAHAAEGSQYGTISQYGEVTRFGGFDTTWFDGGEYDGKGTSGPSETEPKPGLLLNPVGFAVDTNDEGKGTTAIYVLDRVSGYPKAGSLTTEWRLQKLSNTGTVLGTTEFSLPETLVTDVNVPTGVVGLAIDDTTGRIYTLVYETTGSGSSATSYAKEIVGWSTTPNSEDKLVAPGASGSYPALPEETSGPITPVSGYKAPGLLTAALASPSPALYGPLSLALDVTDDQDYLAVEADSKVKTGDTNEGPAIVEQVSTASGTETASWSASSLTTAAFPNASSKDHTAPAAGIATDPDPTQDGSLEVLLDSTGGVNPVTLQANLTTPTILDSSKIENSDDFAKPISTLDNELAAGSAVVELSNGLYAADLWENGAGVGYWNEGENEGIRLLAPEAEGLLSNPTAPATSIFDTLGNATPGGACSISGAGAASSNEVVLTAGAGGAIWALTAGQDSSGYSGSGSDTTYTAGREVIEFSPGAAKTCVGPSGTFLWTKEGGSQQPASEPQTVPVGSTVDFNASAIDYPTSVPSTQAAIYAYEWDFTGASTGGTDNNGYTTISTTAGSELAPAATASYQYKTPGEYTAKLKLLGTFGEYDETGTVVVQTAEPPTAAFTAPAEAQVNQPVSFDASGSAPASGQTIADYHWSFGGGATDDTQEPIDTHQYTTPGTYTVTLTVRDKDNRESESISQQITVTSPPASNSNGGNNSGNNTGGGTLPTTVTPVSPTTPTTPPAKTSSTPKPLTTAQKLANALKACKKDKPKKKRETCEKQAKKKYAPKPKSKKKSKSKKK